jgi:hypothetical protein
LGYVAHAILRAPSPPAPTSCGFHPPKLAKRTPRPPYLGSLGYGKLLEEYQRGGCQNRSKRTTECKKMTFSRNDPSAASGAPLRGGQAETSHALNSRFLPSSRWDRGGSFGAAATQGAALSIGCPPPARRHAQMLGAGIEHRFPAPRRKPVPLQGRTRGDQHNAPEQNWLISGL